MSETELIVEAMLPTFSDESLKATYLKYRVANFTVRESVELSGIHEKTVRRWRVSDPNFARIDGEGLTEERQKLATEMIGLQFNRNFHLVLQKDFKVLYKDAINLPLTEHEDVYLNKIRSHYTPQSLAMIKQLLGGGSVEEPFNFTKFVMTIKQERTEVQIAKEVSSG